MRNKSRLLVLLVMGSSLWASSQTGAKLRCHNIHTKGEGQIHFATNSSDGRFLSGLLHGTTHGEFTFTGPNTYEGTFTIITHHGILVLNVMKGVFDQVTGEFSNDGTVTAGTGRFEQASGRLFFQGFVALPGDHYTDHIIGEVCFEREPEGNDDHDM